MPDLRVMDTYDFIIVGGGPAGLTLATVLSAKNFRIAIVDREPSLGGCHRVRRDSHGWFGEHGPRVYSGSYTHVQAVLASIGLQWDDVFVKTEFAPDKMDGKRWFQHLTPREVFALCTEFIPFLLWNAKRGSKESVLHFCTRSNFSDASTSYMDRICRFSDGAGADRYPLHKFMSGFDAHVLYNFYRPRGANDTGLFAHWERVLRDRGVDIFLGQNDAVHMRGSKSVVLASHQELHAEHAIILAMPPTNCVDLLSKSHRPIPRGMPQFAEDTEYGEYLNVTFHFSTAPFTREPEKLFRSTPWGIAYLPQFGGHVLSTAATLLSVPSPRTGKTAHQSTRKQLAEEILDQLRRATGIALRPVRVVISSGLSRSANAWDDKDTAYVKTANTDYWPSFELEPGVYTVGTHTGRSSDAFTSMESAVQNALALAHTLYPHGDSPVIAANHAWTARHIVRLVLLAVLAILFARFFIQKSSHRI